MSLHLDPRATALALIDVQQGILSMPLAPYDALQIVGNAAWLGRGFAKAGATVVLVHVAFSSRNADKPNQLVDVPMQVPPGDLPPEWSDFAPELRALPAAIIITKRHWGAFHGTELDLQLRRRRISTIVLAGIATNFGVESTAREAWQHNYTVVVAEDACTSISAELHNFSMEKILPRVARVRSSAEIMAALQPA